MTTHGEGAAKTRFIESKLSSQATLLVGRPPTPRRYLKKVSGERRSTRIFWAVQESGSGMHLDG